jgi:hypothetical protein
VFSSFIVLEEDVCELGMKPNNLNIYTPSLVVNNNELEFLSDKIIFKLI